MEKIGVGITTYNRPEQLQKLVNSLPLELLHAVVIVNDGSPIDIDLRGIKMITNETNLGVGKSKNKCIADLVVQDCKHLFLIEDDIYIKRPEVFEAYINASRVTGIQHFNFSQHGVMNMYWPSLEPKPRTIIDYGSLKLPLYPHCVGAFSYYTRRCINEVGYIDERFYNACEHVEHTYRIVKAGMHPPFWCFADIEDSASYLGDEQWSLQQSKISCVDGAKSLCVKADAVFESIHGAVPTQIPDYISNVAVELKQIHKKYGPNASYL